jgi:hypothetical protein
MSDDLRNALTIASGGLSGGISASIAGGSFWAGVRQGLITSGLNHVAHSLSLKNKNIKTSDKPEDIIKINTKDKTATIEYTGTDDIIYVDGEKVMTTSWGLLQESLELNGYDVQTIGPRPLGMGLTDLALDVFGGIGASKFFTVNFSKYFGKTLFTSKLVGYGSKYFGRYHPKYLPDGVKDVFNKGILRTGWGNNNGINTFRTSIGNTGKHIDWFHVPK